MLVSVRNLSEQGQQGRCVNSLAAERGYLSEAIIKGVEILTGA
jgi:hypothetical protein